MFFCFGFSVKVNADNPYNATGTLYSGNLLAGQTVNDIDYFGYNATIPSGTTLQVMFSQDDATWYSATHTLNTWTTLQSGNYLTNSSDTNLNLSGFTASSNLYYKVLFTSNSSNSETPTLTSIQLYYNTLVLPAVSTEVATSITGGSALGNATVSSIGNSTITTEGFQYGLTQTPTFTVSRTGSYGADDYSLTLPNLIVNTVYYVRAFVTNTQGTAYGSWQTFTTNSSYYNATGTLYSGNLLAGQTVASINSFHTSATVPSGTSLFAQFSQNNNSWYSATGILNGTTVVPNSTATISLSALNWDSANFYYKMTFNADPTLAYAPTLNSVSVNYTISGSTYYWVGGAGASINVDGNWSTSPGACDAGNGNGNVPGPADTAVFNSNCTNNATIDTNWQVAGLSITSGYTGTITQSGNNIVNIGLSGFSQAGGTFSAGSTGITVSGNWSNFGTFIANQSTVTLRGTGQTISGNTTFYNLTKSVTSADTLTFGQGTTQTINNTLALNGTSGNLLSLVSSSLGTQWYINPKNTINISYLSVKDSNNVNLNPIVTVDLNIIDSGDNANWTFGDVYVNDSRLVWSPYNWHVNGSAWTETSPDGGYVKVAFTGDTLALGVDLTSQISEGVSLDKIRLDAYIDGSSTPITKTLADASNSFLTFSSTLSSGNHYAIIYLSSTFWGGGNDRWIIPTSVVRITKIQFANDGTGNILSLAGTPLEKKNKKILIYGDSITEGALDPGAAYAYAEYAYSAVLGKDLGVEYGQVAYSGMGWTVGAQGGGPYFYNSSGNTTALWTNYSANASRLVNGSNISSGFIDGVPDAVFVNLGVNDAGGSSGSSLMRTKIIDWLTDIRQTIGYTSKIFVISPFNFGNIGNSAYTAYKPALLGGVEDYQTANPSDTRVYLLDLGISGYNTVQANSSDGLHPNYTGSAILGQELADLVYPYIFGTLSSNVSSIIKGSVGNDITLTGVNTSWTLGTPTFTISGGTGASITTQTITSSTTANLVVNAGTSTGTLTITDLSTGATTTVIVAQNSIKQITSFSFQGLNPTVVATIIGTTITATVPYGTNVTTLVPTITITGSSVSPASEVSNNFTTNPQTYTVTAADTTTQDYHVTVTVSDIVRKSSGSRQFLNSCSSFEYSDWSSCANEIQTREVINSYPQSCNINNSYVVPLLSQSCTVVLPISVSDLSEQLSNVSMATTSTLSFSSIKNSTSTIKFIFNNDLSFGMIKEDVRKLQKFLNGNGFVVSKTGAGSIGKETNIFGNNTLSAIIKFQKANKIVPAVGYF